MTQKKPNKDNNSASIIQKPKKTYGLDYILLIKIKKENKKSG